MSLARQMEHLHQYYTPMARTPGKGVLPNRGARVPANPITAKPMAPIALVDGRRVRRLNQSEMERCQLGLCYNCDKNYSRGHNKVCKQLFLLDNKVEDDDEADVGDEETDETEYPVFSLNPVPGVAMGNTMQI